MRYDYADWLTPERLEVEERHWKRVKFHERYGRAVTDLLIKYSPRVVEEFGCGTGWLPTVISPLQYIGYDRNTACLMKAREKNLTRTWATFEYAEIRNQTPRYGDLVCAFAVLKHFGLDELPSLFQRLFGTAECVAFTMPIAPNDMEDGTQFTHSWWSEATLAGMLWSCGLTVVGRDNTDPEEPLISAIRR